MKSILGIGNALTDILAVLPDDSLLTKYHLPWEACSTWTWRRVTVSGRP